MAKVTDLTDVRAEIDSLRREALGYGFQLEGENLVELREEVEAIRKEREGKPSCWARAYDKATPQCRICDLRFSCGGEEALADAALRVVNCDECSVGNLSVELSDEATGGVRDYGCQTDGCTNTLISQTTMYDPTTPEEGDELPPDVEKETVGVKVKVKRPRKKTSPKKPPKRVPKRKK